MSGLDLVQRVTTLRPYQVRAASPSTSRKIAVYDFGMKRDILQRIASLGCQVVVYPATTHPDGILDAKFDGVVLSSASARANRCRVGSGAHGSLRGNDTDVAFGHSYCRAGSRLDDADHRNGKLLFENRQGRGRGGIAGNYEHLDVAAKQEVRCLACISLNRVLRLGAAGYPREVGVTSGKPT